MEIIPSKQDQVPALLICSVKVPGSSLDRDTTFPKWSSLGLKRHASTEPQIAGRSRSVPSISPAFRYLLSFSYSMLQSKLLTKTLN